VQLLGKLFFLFMSYLTALYQLLTLYSSKWDGRWMYGECDQGGRWWQWISLKRGSCEHDNEPAERLSASEGLCSVGFFEVQ